jgi:hypothetical protein
MTDRSSLSLNRRQALAGVSAMAFAAGVGAPLAAASPGLVLPAGVGRGLTDMTGHAPAYNASIGFGRPRASAALIDDPYDLIFA